MLDLRTPSSPHFTLYVDDFYKSREPKRRPGPEPTISESEVVTLAIFARFSRFASERDFYRYAESSLRNAFPTLPERSQLNRRVRSLVGLLEEVAVHLAQMMGIGGCPFEALDSAAMVVRDSKRRGAGWLAGEADIGWSNRLGWYEGFKLLVAVSKEGVITGFGFSCASTAEQPLAETFFDSRSHSDPPLASVGRAAASGCYVADKGFEGAENHLRWLERYGARIIHPPKRNSRRQSWPKQLRRWVAGIPQIVETVY